MNHPDNFSQAAFDRRYPEGDRYTDALDAYEERKAEAQTTLRALHHMKALKSSSLMLLCDLLGWVSDAFADAPSAIVWAANLQQGAMELLESAEDDQFEEGLHDVFSSVFGAAVNACHAAREDSHA